MSQLAKRVFIYFGAILKTTSAGSCASGPAVAAAGADLAAGAGKKRKKSGFSPAVVAAVSGVGKNYSTVAKIAAVQKIKKSFKFIHIYFGSILKTMSAGSCASGPVVAAADADLATGAGKKRKKSGFSLGVGKNYSTVAKAATTAAAGKTGAIKNIQKSFKFIHIYFGSILKTMSAGSCASGPATSATAAAAAATAAAAAISQIFLNDAVYSISSYHKIKRFINTFLTPPQGLAMT